MPEVTRESRMTQRDITVSLRLEPGELKEVMAAARRAQVSLYDWIHAAVIRAARNA